MALVGVWRALWRLGDYRLKHLLWPEGLPALVVGVGGAAALVRVGSVADRMAMMDTIVQLAVALLAVVFTALAIMVALPAGSYLRALQKDDAESDGMQRFLEPFLLTLGVEVAVVLLALGYSLSADAVSATVEHGSFYALGFLVVYGLLDVVALARSIVRHGIGRAQDAVREAQRDEKITAISEHRSGERS
ncbi:MAG: hypothetical protein WD810_02005 [Solirubrobacterales bacterium]